MRLKLLLVSVLMFSGVLYAQDTIRTLVITEARIDRVDEAYVELTNMGTTDLDLLNFEIGANDPWSDPYSSRLEGGTFIIGEFLNEFQPGRTTIIKPGESFTIASVGDFDPEQWLIDPDNYGEIVTKKEHETIADIQLHYPENNGGPGTSDSITPYGHYNVLTMWGGRDNIFLRYHFLDANGQPDSAQVDVVNGVYDSDNGRNQNKPYDCAGVTDASNNATLIRRFSVKEGNLDYATARGSDLGDSEWMPIPHLRDNYEPQAALFWTAGNHGDYNLDANSLKDSDNEVDVDFTTNVITVPWGVRNRDSLMFQFDYSPGLAWHYDYSPVHEDSAFVSARTGDTLTVYACGSDLDMVKFHIELAPPTDDANIVVPKSRKNDDGFYDYGNNSPGFIYGVSNKVPGMDTIFDVEFSLRKDTLLKYLEKAPDANWEIVWVDGVERPDLLNGDKLKVTSKSGNEKEYYIKIEDFKPSHNADLSSITWPDIPELYKLSGIYGWMGDTVPNFSSKKYEYRVTVKGDVDGIPALVAKTDDLGAKLEVTRAVNLFGTVSDKTVSFKTTAEDDSTVNLYTVQIERAVLTENVQPWVAEPFISEVTMKDQFANGFVEICNPGTEPLELSGYMFFQGGINDPVEAIQAENDAANWADRYRKYIPGYKWALESDWTVTPRMAVEETSVNSLIQPGDVFVMAYINEASSGLSGYPWWASEQTDIDFWHDPWGEDYTGASCVPSWHTGSNIYMWKILNDSIQRGLKPATDPEDFELLESFGPGDGTRWVIGDYTVGQINTFRRKPEFFLAKPGFKESWGTTSEDSEWLVRDGAWGSAANLGWPMRRLYVTEDQGQHFMNAVSIYKSTISSVTYITSEGYSMNENVKGVVDGTTVEQFLPEIIKIDPDQTLTVISGTTGDTLAVTDAIVKDDILVVLSADMANTSKYYLDVTAGGLSNDAVLISTDYTVSVTGATGTIEGFDYGTKLTAIVGKVTKPAGSLMNIIDEEDAYVSLVQINFDSAYVDVMVSDQIFFEVVAEDGATAITYQLKPTSDPADAFVLSSVYDIDQETKLIQYIPEGTTISSFMSNITPAAGATVQMKDKASFDRNSGNIYMDDKLIVTASDGVTMNAYFLAMLEAEANYLAYVLSSVYLVDQNAFTIVGVPEEDLNEITIVSAFIANLNPAAGASIAVLDMDMNVKAADDDMDAGDILMVTAGNGVAVNYYTITVNISSARNMFGSEISVYPNPSNGVVYVEGLEQGNRIQIFNSLGSSVYDHSVVNSTEMISLENQGFYFMTITNEAEVIGVHKLIVE
jgi:hypothetical protein